MKQTSYPAPKSTKESCCITPLSPYGACDVGNCSLSLLYHFPIIPFLTGTQAGLGYWTANPETKDLVMIS